jgi:transposase
MPKKIDAELRARAVRLVNEHAGEYAVLLSGMTGRAQPLPHASSDERRCRLVD